MKVDLHVHSTASDGSMSPEEVLREAKRKGLDGIAITDHDTVKGCKVAKDIAEKTGLVLIPGIEVSTDRGHMLVLGTEREPRSTKFGEVLKFAEENDAVTVGAHPFAKTKVRINPDYLKKLDAVEVLNGRTYPRGNEDAVNFALEEQMPQVAGSDAHTAEELGKIWTEVEGGDPEEILQSVVKGECKAVGESRSTLSLTLHKLKSSLI